jgi:A/G-specific adenine glycosylase
LQQTQVATVVAYFQRWMERFPDLRALAAAEEEAVLEAWAGLGYYSRARNILAAARRIESHHGGVFPWRKQELLGLPGIGEYTAGAIASLAYNLPEPILDGNLIRVFSRLYGWDFLPDSKQGRKTYWEMARDWAGSHVPGLVNEGLMELGALLCAPRNPRCEACPLAGHCRARKENRQAQLPPAKSRKESAVLHGFALVVRHGEDVLLYRPRKPEVLAGLLTFPVMAAAAWKDLRKAWKEIHPDSPWPEFRPRAEVVNHSITHRQFRLRIAEGRWDAGDAPSSLPEGYQWAPARKVEKLLVSSLSQKIWERYREGPAGKLQQRKAMARLEK